jgi:hypothetical protein
VKDKKHLTRLTIILGIGIFLTYEIYQSRFSSFLFDTIFFVGLSIIGVTFWLWWGFKDLKKYKSTKKNQFLIGPLMGVIFIGLISGLNWKNNADFNKPTLLRVYYNGDFNGTSIDFKTDGTYIIDNHAIGFSDYTYGTYQIKGEVIILDKNEIGNVIKSNRLEIKKKEISGTDISKNYLFQIREDGIEVERAIEFRVVVDNRE